MADDFDLARFVAAQEASYADALAELRAGAKRSHWMWYVFPQIAGLGQSPIARRYAISGLDEARAYLAHPLLGARLRECVAALDALTGTTAERVMGGIDAVKLRSSLTLFEAAGAGFEAAGAGFEAAGGGDAFGQALEKWFAGRRDAATLERV